MKASKLTTTVIRMAVGAALLFSLAGAAFGADPPKGEVIAYGGGVSVSDGGGSHALVGAGVGGDVASRVHVFAEFSYIPMGSASFGESGSGYTASANASVKMVNFGGGMEVNVGQKAARESVSATGTATVGGSSATSSLGSSANAVYIGGGGGVRFYVADHWGLRPEFRFLHYTNGGGNVATYTFGLFYRFGQ